MRSKPFQIGITGGIAVGKSIVCKVFACLGVPVYDADSRAKSIMTADAVLVDGIKKAFGDQSYQSDGSLNRRFLAQEVFNKTDKLKLLNELVHPRVGIDYKNWLTEHKEHAYVIKEAALLFESGSYKQLDEVIVVTSPKEIRTKRLLARDPERTSQEISEIMRKQMTEEEKIARATYVIYNDETQLVIPQVLKLHERFNQGMSQ